MSMYGRYPKNEDGTEQKAWPTTDCSNDPGFTVQADSDDADINKIIARYNKSGQLPPVRGGEPFYGDVSDLDGLQGAMMKIQEAEQLFMSYPAEVRERFDNDPVKMVEFLGDERNRREAEELGLVVKRPEPVESVAVAPTQLPS